MTYSVNNYYIDLLMHLGINDTPDVKNKIDSIYDEVDKIAINPKLFFSFLDKHDSYSGIRLGDGEGSYIFYLNSSVAHKELALENTRLTNKIMFGNKKFQSFEIDRIAEDLNCAIMGATLLGLPTRKQTESVLNGIISYLNFDQAIDHRGSIGYLNSFSILSNRNYLKNKHITSSHFHIDFLDSMDQIFGKYKNICIITCYQDLGVNLSNLYPSCKFTLILIPPQAQNVKSTPDESHFHSYYKNIVSNLSRESSAELFLVAAGILGKYYCEVIRRNTGKAIDVGSAIDVLMGKGVRRWHNIDKINKYKLI